MQLKFKNETLTFCHTIEIFNSGKLHFLAGFEMSHFESNSGTTPR